MKPTLFYTRHLGDMLNVLDRPISKRNVFLLIASTTGLIAHTGHRGLYKIKKKKIVLEVTIDTVKRSNTVTNHNTIKPVNFSTVHNIR